MAQEIGPGMAENPSPVAAPPDASRLSAAELGAALRALPYRTSAFLVTHLVQRRALAASAAFYGISPEAFSVHLLRAALELARRVGGTGRAPGSDVEEEVWARALTEALEREGAAVPSAVAEGVALCRRLHALGPEVTAVLEATEREEERSPKRRREDVLRRLAVLALLALTAWLYFNRPPEPPPPTVQPRTQER